MKYYKSCKSFLFIVMIALCLFDYLLYYFTIINWEGLIYGSFIFLLYLANKYFGKVSLDNDVIKIEYLFTTYLFPNDLRRVVHIDELSNVETKKIFGFEIIYLKYKVGKTCFLPPKCQSRSFLEAVNRVL